MFIVDVAVRLWIKEAQSLTVDICTDISMWWAKNLVIQRVDGVMIRAGKYIYGNNQQDK